MNDRDALYGIAQEFLDAVAAGDLPDAMLTDDMTAWITSGRTMARSDYRQAIRLLARMSARPLAYTVHGLTADEDRVVIEASSEGELIDGQPYANTYVFVLRIRDGRIAAVAEHYNALIAQERLLPLMNRLMADGRT